MHDETRELVDMHHKAIYGDPENIKAAPGILSDQMRMSFEQARTNEILLELRDSLARINWLIIAGFVTAIGSTIYRTVH